MKNYSKNHNRGFTLIEIMMAAGISIMLALAAAPYFTSRLPRYEMDNTTGEISGYLRSLRNEAISRNETLHFQTKNNFHTLDIYDEDNVVIKTIEITDYKKGSIHFDNPKVFFNSQGQLLAPNLSYTTLTITIGDSRSTDTRQIRVTSNGRIKIHEG